MVDASLIGAPGGASLIGAPPAVADPTPTADRPLTVLAAATSRSTSEPVQATSAPVRGVTLPDGVYRGTVHWSHGDGRFGLTVGAGRVRRISFRAWETCSSGGGRTYRDGDLVELTGSWRIAANGSFIAPGTTQATPEGTVYARGAISGRVAGGRATGMTYPYSWLGRHGGCTTARRAGELAQVRWEARRAPVRWGGFHSGPARQRIWISTAKDAWNSGWLRHRISFRVVGLRALTIRFAAYYQRFDRAGRPTSRRLRRFVIRQLWIGPFGELKGLWTTRPGDPIGWHRFSGALSSNGRAARGLFSDTIEREQGVESAGALEWRTQRRWPRTR